MATWTIDRLEYAENAAGQSKVLNVVHWCASASKGDQKAERHGTSTLAYKEGEPFVPFDKLTEAQVIGWVHAQMGEDWVKGIEAELARELEQQPVTADKLPWAAE